MNWNKFLPCILLTTVLGACSGKGEQTNVEPAALCLTDSLLRIVSVDTVHVQEVIDELTLNGRVTFNENQVAHVYPMFGGTVTELKAEIGDFVRKGDVLAVIRSGEVADYEKQLKEAEQQLLLARRNMDATQDMYASGMASDKDVLQAKQELTSAEAEERRIKDVCRNMVVTDAAHCGDCAGTADQRSVFVIVCGVCPWRTVGGRIPPVDCV